MCGFVAVLSPDAVPREADITRMRDLLTHRGPDSGANAIVELPNGKGGVGIGFRRLSIQDPGSSADQPMFSGDQTRVIAFNGEIYNFWELRRELEGRGRRFRTKSDTEVLLQSYEEWGIDCLERFNGMFAFFIWDSKLNRGVVARDRFGEKPLYFARTAKGQMVFGSEIKAIVAHQEMGCRPNIECADAFIGFASIHSSDDTVFEGVERFRAAHFMVVSAGGTVESYRRYWTPDYENIDHSLADSDAQEQFRAHMERAIGMRTRTDVPGSACLSGGLDSSTIVGNLARSQNVGEAFSFREAISARFPDDPTIDEGEYIRDVLEMHDLNGQSVLYSEQELLADIPRLHWHHEETIPGLSMYLEWGVMRRARERGYKVMLDGQGADELLGGYTDYFQYFQHDAYSDGRYLSLLTNIVPQWFRLWSLSFKYSSVYRRVGRRFSVPFREFRDLDRETWINPEIYGEKLGLPNCVPGNEFRYKLATELLYVSLPTQLHSGDRNSMAHGVETRFPFLDYEFVDWCIKLPREQMIRWGKQKYLMRKAGKGILPKSVMGRCDKVGYLSPQDRWFRGVIGEWVSDQLSSSTLDQLPSFDRETLEGRQKEHEQGLVDHSAELWRWASTAQWLSMFKTGAWTQML